MIRARLGFFSGVLFTLLVVVGISCGKAEQPAKAPPAAKVFVHDDKMKETLVDVFPGMDGPDLNLTPDDIRGRVVWKSLGRGQRRDVGLPRAAASAPPT
jgi:hypothetical protein